MEPATTSYSAWIRDIHLGSVAYCGVRARLRYVVKVSSRGFGFDGTNEAEKEEFCAYSK
jgi:hypothetical protein